MDNQITDRPNGVSITPRALLGVAVAYLAITYLAECASMLLAIVTGPFASLIVGGILLAIAAKIYRCR